MASYDAVSHKEVHFGGYKI